MASYAVEGGTQSGQRASLRKFSAVEKRRIRFKQGKHYIRQGDAQSLNRRVRCCVLRSSGGLGKDRNAGERSQYYTFRRWYEDM